MSLNFDYSKIEDKEVTREWGFFNPNYSMVLRFDSKEEAEAARTENCSELEQYTSRVTEAIVWRMMSVGMAAIKSDNVMEVYTRSRIFESLFLPTLDEITHAEFMQHVGLSTNVKRETTAAWRKRILDYYAADLLYKITREVM